VSASGKEEINMDERQGTSGFRTVTLEHRSHPCVISISVTRIWMRPALLVLCLSLEEKTRALACAFVKAWQLTQGIVGS
jgi:hypothetical protein